MMNKQNIGERLSCAPKVAPTFMLLSLSCDLRKRSLCSEVGTSASGQKQTSPLAESNVSVFEQHKVMQQACIHLDRNIGQHTHVERCDL
jgi:hypothetical protein